MKYSNAYGHSFPEYGLVPAPSYLLRRWAVLKLLNTLPKGNVLEIGYASGTLLIDLGIFCSLF